MLSADTDTHSSTDEVRLPGPSITTATIVGAGLMGRRLAAVFAGAGVNVRLTDQDTALLSDAVADAQAVAESRAADSGNPAGEVTAATTLRGAAADSEFVTEAIVEKLAAKRALFAELSEIAPGAILASNSSVIPISHIAADAAEPSLCVGTHWWNPPDLIPIVEVISGVHTSDTVKDTVMTLMASLGKTPVWVRRDVPGFVGNRLQHALWREAIALVNDGVADAETVDLVVRNTIGLRLAQMGPLENADYVGLDLTRAIHEAVLPALDRSTEPSPLLCSLVDAGRLGAKTGQGFLAWPPGSRETVGAALASHVATQMSINKEQ